MEHQSTQKTFNPRRALWAGMASMGIVTLLIVMKSATWWVSGSASVMGSLIDSIADAAVSFMSFMAIHHSMKPADENHRYGHGKIEGLMALLQAGFIGIGAVLLAVEGATHLSNPHPVIQPAMGIAVMVVSSILTLVLIRIQKDSYHHAPSLAVESDREHYASDLLVNGAVVAALVLQMVGVPAWIDPFFAVLIALWLGRVACTIGAKGVDMLLDRELPDEKRSKIISIIGANPDIHGFHDLRTRMSGMELYISFDVEIDPALTLARAHAISKDIERSLLHEFPNAQIMIHKDPVGETEDSRHKGGGMRETA